MNDNKYNELIDNAFLALEEALDVCEVDIDYESAEGILTLIFPNQSKMVLNKQPPLQQLWVATKFNGHHFNYHDNGLWIDQRTDAEFWSFMDEAASIQAEQTIQFNIKER